MIAPVALFAYFALWLPLGIDFNEEIIIDPYEVTSPSGSWHLAVEPGDRFGAGASVIRTAHNGAPAHELSLPYTFQIAAITDDGYVVGIGRTERRGGELVVGVIGPDGTPIREERHERTVSRTPHTPPNPNVKFLVVDPDSEWLIVAVADPDTRRGEEAWWRYPIRTDGPRVMLSPGRGLGDARGVRLHAIDAEAIPGTPWILTHWYRYEPRAVGFAVVGAVYVLGDSRGEVHWRMDLPKDYDDRTSWTARRNGGILDVLDRRFALWHAAVGERVEYRVAGDTNADPLVVEVGRRPFDWQEQMERARPADLPARRLAASSAIPLLPQGEATPLHDLCDFGFDQAGEPIAIRRDGPGRFTTLRFSASGAVAGEVTWDALLEPLASGSVELHAIRAATWLLSARAWDDAGGEGMWFEVDAMSGTLRRLSGMDDVRAGGVAADASGADGTSDGGFVALIAAELVRCDADGNVLWQVREEYEDPTKLFGPADVATLTDGSIAVLETVPNKVKVYSSAGRWLRTIDLEQAFKKEPNYPTSIHAHKDGGFLVHDFHGDPTLWQLSADGEVVANWTPTLATGHAPEVLSRQARPGPDGAVWTRDEGAVHSLDSNGVVARTYGSAPNQTRLASPGEVKIDTLGRAWILDKRSGSRFAFNLEGRLVWVARFAPEDGDPARYQTRIVARPDGGVLIEQGECVVRFDGEGRRLGQAPQADGSIYLELPNERFVWGDTFDPLRILGRAGDTIATIDRMPDGTWSGSPSSAAWSVDGRAALLRGGVVLLDSEGRPERTIPFEHVPRIGSQISINGDYAMVSSRDPEAMLYSFSEDRWERVVVAKDKARSWAMGLSPDGEEVLAVDEATHTLRRYPLR